MRPATLQPLIQSRAVRGPGETQLRYLAMARAALVLTLTLASCASPTAGTQVFEGRLAEPDPSKLVGARQLTGRNILLETGRSGSFTNAMTMTLDPAVKVYAAGKESELRQIQTGSPVRVFRDRETHRVKRIELLASLPSEDEVKTTDPKATK